VLVLPQGDNIFQQDKPFVGIAAVTVTNVEPNSIRVTVTGEAGVPKVELYDSDEGLIFGFTPIASATQAKPTPPQQPKQPSAQTDEPIELVVTGELDGYSVQNATTGTRTDTPLRDIPQSIQVVPQQVLRDQQAIRLDEALRNVSGVTFSGTTGGTEVEFNIRGFDNAPILRDGFRQYGNGDYEGIPETANLERIEVLKGPASILYGEVQPGGVINLVTKKPLSQPFYQGELQVGNYGLIRPSLDISGPVTSDGSLLYRLNALYQKGESFRDFNTDIERFFVSPVLSWQIGKQTDLTVQLQYYHDERPLDNGIVAIANRVADVPRDTPSLRDAPRTESLRERITGEPDDSVESDSIDVGYDLEHRFSKNWTLRNAFRYVSRNFLNKGFLPFEFDESTGVVTRYFGQQDIDSQRYSLQSNLVGKFATGSIQHTLLFGVDLNRSEFKEFTGLDFFTPALLNIFDPVYGASRPSQLPLARNTQDRQDRLGVYLQDQVALSDNLKLLAGLRYDTVKQTTENKPTDFDLTRSETTQNDDALTPRIGIVYQPIPEVSLYANYSRSFTPNTATTVNRDPLEPERGEGYEVGVKAELLRGRLSTTLAYFDITKQNVASTDPNSLLDSVATGEQQSRGIELDVRGQILPGWNIIAAYAYTDAEVTEDKFIEIGNRLPGTPKHSASLWTTYEFQQSLQGLGFGIGFNYVGERQGDLDNSFRVDSYFLTNAAIYYRRNNWRAALNFKNLFDINYIQAASNRLFEIEKS
jgi:iron complex outermembrane receptor protein